MSRALALLLIVTLVLFACVPRLRSTPALHAGRASHSHGRARQAAAGER